MSVTTTNVPSLAGTLSDVPRITIPSRLYPKEHGAYAILGVPLSTALFIVGLMPVTVLLSIATIAAFLAHEPQLILAGGRGTRVGDAAPQAVRLLLGRLAVALVCGARAFWMTSPIVRLGMIACLLFAMIDFALAAAGKSRTLAAQILAVAGLALPSAVVLMAGGVDLMVAGQFLLIWFAGRMATTVSVRLVIAQHKSSTSLRALRRCDMLLIVAGIFIGVGLVTGNRQWIAAIPMLVAAVLLRFHPPHPSRLKQIGWSLLVVNIASGIGMIWLMAHRSIL